MALEFERSSPPGGPLVRGFSKDGFSIGDQSYRAALLTPEAAASWDPPELGDLGADHLGAILALDPPPEFLILGTGSAMAFAPRPLVEALEARGIGIEAMDSRAAARTWGLLRAEGRWIAAALLPFT